MADRTVQDIPRSADIAEAAERIRPFARKTPVFTCSAINTITGASLFFKCENFQKVGAFKFRGAANAVFKLSDKQAAKGVATHSSGNHAAALALAARLRRIPAYIVMPANAAEIKKKAAAGYGAQITFCEPTLAAREETLKKVVEQTGAVFIHPYNHPHIIAGQGTATPELLSQTDELDYLLAPVGGGGLLSGTSLAAAAFSPRTQVIGAEPEGADDAYRSLQAGRIIPSENPQTIADGLLTSLGPLTFEILRLHVRRIIRVSERDILRAMRLIWERMKIIVEPSAAVPLGALLGDNFDFRGKRVGIILSGGNVDLDRLPWSGS